MKGHVPDKEKTFSKQVSEKELVIWNIEKPSKLYNKKTLPNFSNGPKICIYTPQQRRPIGGK